MIRPLKSLGASASAVGQALLRHQTIIIRIAGLLVVVLGLHTLGLIRIPFLFQERRLTVGGKDGSYVGALVLGAAFAAGWTPCIDTSGCLESRVVPKRVVYDEARNQAPVGLCQAKSSALSSTLPTVLPVRS